MGTHKEKKKEGKEKEDKKERKKKDKEKKRAPTPSSSSSSTSSSKKTEPRAASAPVPPASAETPPAKREPTPDDEEEEEENEESAAAGDALPSEHPMRRAANEERAAALREAALARMRPAEPTKPPSEAALARSVRSSPPPAEKERAARGRSVRSSRLPRRPQAEGHGRCHAAIVPSAQAWCGHCGGVRCMSWKAWSDGIRPWARCVEQAERWRQRWVAGNLSDSEEPADLHDGAGEALQLRSVPASCCSSVREAPALPALGAASRLAVAVPASTVARRGSVADAPPRRRASVRRTA